MKARLPIRLLAPALLVLLGGCSTVSEFMREAPVDGPSLALVSQNPAAHEGARVVWGGSIARVETLAESSLIEVVERRLGGSGRPLETDASAGRFVILVDRFLDPAIYAAGREVSAIGTLGTAREGRVGERTLVLPTLAADKLKLWAPRPDYVPAADPWYRPYPFGPYPPGFYPDYYDPYWWPYYSPYPRLPHLYERRR